MITNKGIYDPLPEEVGEETTLQCVGCNGRVSASDYPPGVPCPQCRNIRRRLLDGRVLPPRSVLPWIILIDFVVTVLLVAGIVYYFARPSAGTPQPTAVATSGPSRMPDTEASPAVPAADPTTEETIAFLETLPEAELDLPVGLSGGDGTPAISGVGEVPPWEEAVEPEFDLAAATPEAPTITGDDMPELDDDYEPIEFVNTPAATADPRKDAVAASSPWALASVIHANVHDAFAGRSLDATRWTSSFFSGPEPCQAYFMLSRERLLVGATEGRPQGPETLTWTTQFVSDFEVSIDFRWILQPRDGQCGLYLEWLDNAGVAMVFLDLVSWAADEDARKLIFRCGGPSGAVSSRECPVVGRIRVRRQSSRFSAEVWDQQWYEIGSAETQAGPLRLRLSGYSSSSCPRYAVALDDFEFTHESRSVQQLRDRRSATGDATEIVASEMNPAGATGDRPGVVSIREAPNGSGAAKRPYSVLPHAMAALPTGAVVADMRNASDRDIMVGLRRSGEGLDLRVPVGATKRAMIPAGNYTLIMRDVDSLGGLLQSDEVSVPEGSSTVLWTVGVGNVVHSE